MSGWYSLHSPCLIGCFIHSFSTPLALSFDSAASAILRIPSRFKGSQQAEHGTGGKGEQRTSPAVHRRFVLPAAMAGVRWL
jgi:hypothetical protein